MASIITRDSMVRTGIVVGEEMIGSHRVPNATTTQREESLGNTLGRGLSPTYSPTFFAVTRIYLHGLASAYFPTYPPTHHNPQRIPQQLPLNLSTQRIPQHAK